MNIPSPHPVIRLWQSRGEYSYQGQRAWIPLVFEGLGTVVRWTLKREISQRAAMLNTTRAALETRTRDTTSGRYGLSAPFKE